MSTLMPTLLEVLLDHRRLQPVEFRGGRLERERQPRLRPIAVGVAIAGLVQQPLRLVRIVVEGEHVRLERPIRRRQHADGGCGEAPPQVIHDGPPIDREADRAPDAKVLQDWIEEIEGEVLIVEPRRGFQGQAVLLELIDDIRRKVVDDEIGAALSQLEPLHDVVGHDLQHDAGISRRAVVVVGEPLDLQAIVHGVSNELIRSGANGMLAQFVSRAIRHDLHHQIDQERAGGTLRHKLHGVAIERGHGLQIPVAAPVRRRHFRVENAGEGVNHVLRRELVPVVEMNAPAQMHGICLVVRLSPRTPPSPGAIRRWSSSVSRLLKMSCCARAETSSVP